MIAPRLPLLLLAALAVPPARAVEVPPGFTVETLATGLNAMTALAPLPDGGILLADQTGPLRLWRDGRVLERPALDLGDRLDTYWERGLVGVTVHPDFPRPPHVFVLYVAQAPHTHHVLARFSFAGDALDPASEKILLEGEDQKKFPGPQTGGHQGGPLRFGPDGKLYVSLGEQTARTVAQRLDALPGKILRVNADGTIPEDNPFFATTTGRFRAIWARGLRNPFGLAFEPGTGRLFATDVGQTGWEEVNEIKRGANYGWPHAEGIRGRPDFTDPLHAYPPAVGRSIVGAAFSPRAPRGTFPLPAAWSGRFFFADWAANWIKALDPLNPAEVVTFARGLDGPVALEFLPDGSLLVLNRSTIWRDGKKWVANSGSLLRIRHTGATGPAPTAAAPAPVLSATGVAAKRRPFTPTEGLREYTPIAPPWLPGVTVRRWISLPPGAQLRVDPAGEFEFPRGTVIVHHHAVDRTAGPLETHVLVFDGAATHSRIARAAAYRWAGPDADAKLVTEGTFGPLPGDPDRRWRSPAPERELNLDLSVVGYLVPLSPRQLDPAQRAQWIARGWIAPAALAAGTPRLAALDDAAAPLELRVRSYLDANCAGCHRPGGPGRGNFDLRFTPPSGARELAAAALVAGDLGVPGARLLSPGAPEKSVLFLRLNRRDVQRMPAIALSDEPSPVLAPLAAWIRGLADAP